jgi:formate hydrogenlyase subunit 3/multisubunit Na+/H+ antiporter MnhD subunit
MLMIRFAKYLALVTAVAGAALILDPRVVQMGAVVVDLQPVNAVLVLFVSALVCVVAAYSSRNLLGQDQLTRFGVLLVTAFAGLLVMVTAGTLAQFALGWTVSGQATALLIAHAGTARGRRASAYVRSWLTAGDVLVWLAALSALLPTTLQVHITAIDFTGTVTGLLLVLACVARTGLVPAQRWLAQTAEAPSPVSAFLHAGIINAAGITVVLWLPPVRPWLPVLLASACVSLVVGLWTITARADVKGKLASSTSTQMAFMSIEAAVGLPGLALLHLVGHGGYKSWCFLRAGGAITRNRLGHRPRVRSLPVLVLATTAGIATIAAVWALLGTVEVLSATVGLIAAVSVITHAAGTTRRIVAAITAIASVALGAYLVLVHAWLAWLPVPQWQDTGLLLIALAALLIGASGPRLIRLSTMHRITWYLIAPRWMRLERHAGATLPPALSDPYAGDLVRLHELVDTAAGAVAAIPPLRSAVAINPLQALTAMHVTEATRIAAGWGVSFYPTPRHYLGLLDSGDISMSVLERVACGPEAAARLIERTRAIAEGTPHLHEDVLPPAWETAHRWCQLAWNDAQTAGDCFAEWHRSLPERTAQSISDIPIVALHQALSAHLGMQPPDPEGDTREDSTGTELRLLTSLLRQAPGWAAHARWRGHDALVQLLALRACLTALHPHHAATDRAPAFDEAQTWQQALESTFDEWLDEQLERRASSSTTAPHIGVVTCIDVRSEPMRRALERSGSVRTYGAAGFFGIDARLHINDTTLDLAPVIVTPSLDVQAHARPTMISELAAGIEATMSGVGGLAIAEGYGLCALGASITNTFRPELATRLASLKHPDPWLGSTGLDAGGLPVAAQVEYARRFLDTLGSQSFPRLVAVAGHGADAANNAFASAYQCGACGGNTGAVNARMVVSMLSNPRVREHLVADGYDIQDTVFVAAMHNTTTNTLEIDPTATTPATHEHLMSELMDAAAAAHDWLSVADPDLPGPSDPTRGLDWAQPFPEWGLVGNAACVIGPRDLTVAADLRGRVFLHEYDWTTDPDGSLLRSILQGPGAVMHMINMQYFCSTVDPDAFGSGDKTRHNVVGDIGVLLGASGDLHYGLPWQSVGPSVDRPRHVPVRLRIHVAAPPDLLDIAMSGTTIEQLAANGWLTIAPTTPITAPLRPQHHRAT